MSPARQTDDWTAAARRTVGLWIFEYVVDGYDEPFEVKVLGNMSEGFAQKYGAMQIHLEHGIAHRHIHHKSTRFEGP